MVENASSSLPGDETDSKSPAALGRKIMLIYAGWPQSRNSYVGQRAACYTILPLLMDTVENVRSTAAAPSWPKEFASSRIPRILTRGAVFVFQLPSKYTIRVRNISRYHIEDSRRKNHPPRNICSIHG